MLRVNIEITRNSRSLEQIAEVSIQNRDQPANSDGEVSYAVFFDGDWVGDVWHVPGQGALVLAYRALGVLPPNV